MSNWHCPGCGKEKTEHNKSFFGWTFCKACEDKRIMSGVQNKELSLADTLVRNPAPPELLKTTNPKLYESSMSRYIQIKAENDKKIEDWYKTHRQA